MKLKNILVEVVDEDSDFMKIMGTLKGRINPTDVSFSESWIDGIDKDYIYFEFKDTDEFYDIMTPYDEEDRTDIEWLRGDPSGYYEFDWYYVEEDWNEGHVAAYISDENLETFKKIIFYLKPELRKLSFEDNWDEVRKIVDNNLPKLKDKILNAYWEGRDVGFSNGAEKLSEDITNDILKILGIQFDSSWRYGTNNFEYIKMPLSNLMKMYATVGRPTDSIKTIIELYAEKKDIYFPSYPRDQIYEYEDYKSAKEYFNREIQLPLEYALDEILEEYIPEWNEIYDYVEKKYGFNQILTIPSSPNKENKIILNGLTPEGKLNFTLYGKDERKKEGVAKVSTIDTLFNNYQLFDLFD